MLPDGCDNIEIDNVFYQCGRLKRTVLITYLATVSHSPDSTEHCVPELTAFDCSQKHACGVCTSEGRWMSCRWTRCVHPGLRTQEPSTEAEPSPRSPGGKTP